MTLLFFLSQSTVTRKIPPQNTFNVPRDYEAISCLSDELWKELHSDKYIVSTVLPSNFVKAVLILCYFVYLFLPPLQVFVLCVMCSFRALRGQPQHLYHSLRWKLCLIHDLKNGVGGGSPYTVIVHKLINMFCIGIFLEMQDCEAGGRFLMWRVTLVLSKSGVGTVSVLCCMWYWWP